MQTILYHRILLVSLSLLLLVCISPARADIFQWEYINPSDPSQGKRQSTTLAPSGAGIDAVPGANFYERNLTMAYLIGADLSGVDGRLASLADSDLSKANLTNADFGSAALTGANLTGADVRSTNFGKTLDRGTGITLPQLYSTDSYQRRDLSGIGLSFNNLVGGNFAGQNLSNADLSADLTRADFTGAEVRGASFSAITLAQLYSTASYQTGDLSGVDLSENTLTEGNFVGQNLADASFWRATLTDADFTGAEVRGAAFSTATYYTTGRGFSAAQLYSTASYQAHNLTGIYLTGDLSGWNFEGQNLEYATIGQNHTYDANLTAANLRGTNLTNALLSSATLTGVDFTGAEIRGAVFGSLSCIPGLFCIPSLGTGITTAQLYSTASYQARDLSSIIFTLNNLAGGNFASQNLTNAVFRRSNLNGAIFHGANLANANFAEANLSAADTRGALGLDPSTVVRANLIHPNGHINGLDLYAAPLLVVRDYDGNPTPISITVDRYLDMGPGGTLRMVFETDAWDSTISFAPGIPVTLGGTLELTFADDVNPVTQVGRTLKIFDWTGVNPTGQFAIVSPYAWDTSQLYTTGQVTLTAIPEPATLVMLCTLIIATLFHNCRVTP